MKHGSHSPPASLVTAFSHTVVHADREQVPDEGNGGVIGAIRHMLEFSLELLDNMSLSDVNSEYVQSLHWYKSLPAMLAGNSPR